MNAVLPEQFGKYSLLGHLATGGMAEVWLARQLGLHGFEKIVVIKRARPDLGDRDTTQRFLDEARLVATLEHPNIAQVYEIGFVNGSYFFVMEYVDGADLRRLIEAAITRRRRISLADALYIISHVCTALHYAHEKHDLDGNPLHIIHRDVSPSNVLISRDGAIKVCDFGVAKAHNRRAEITKRGVLKGKFSYMSPEQCDSRPIDRRSDVFSIGILLYELTTLTKLFRAKSELALLQQVSEARVRRPSVRMADYPADLEAIVMTALARDPADRYPTAQALQLDLEAFAREHKLAMSSVGIASLMGELFEKRSEPLIRPARGSGDYPIELTPTPGGPGDMVAFLADGSAPSADTADHAIELAGMMTRSQRSATRATVSLAAPAPQPAHRSSALWLVGAALAGMVAVGMTIADQMVVGSEDRAAASALAADAERVASMFDATARSAHVRADGIATTPMLRAAIETDAATLSDLAHSEMVFIAGKGEALEVYQFVGDKPSSLLRIPKSARALPALKGRDTQLRADASGATLVASAPISGYRGGMGGVVVISMPIDLTSIRRSLEDHAASASLTGLGAELPLVAPSGAPGGTTVKLVVPSSGEWTAGSATLVAAPKKSHGLSWVGPARAASGGLSVLLLIGFVVGLARRPRS
ncbi:MAG TPA: serine/threonine-protein kinase [Kofleriaceae bacterium]|nr:serine/threonine-protein kinase [Kofleriaceae bacterium]